MDKKIFKQKYLGLLINLLWYGGLFSSFVLFVMVILFNLSAIGIVNIRIPFIDVTINKHEYSFNSHYVIVKQSEPVKWYALEQDTTITYLWLKPQNVTAISQVRKYLQPVLFFEQRLVPEIIIGFSLYMFFILLVLLIILYNLRKLFNNYSSDGLFSKDNPELLQYIGAYFIIGELVRVLIFYWISHSVITTSWINLIVQSNIFSFRDINFALLSAGLVFLILASIFRMSAAIKEENDLTV
ncbi:MAG: DUF2975 domain-containing protein [Melioribacteraceae bacterium]|nr:DUF2975 domain-containing protein [Melioribacteraceae bacterium]